MLLAMSTRFTILQRVLHFLKSQNTKYHITNIVMKGRGFDI